MHIHRFYDAVLQQRDSNEKTTIFLSDDVFKSSVKLSVTSS